MHIIHVCRSCVSHESGAYVRVATVDLLRSSSQLTSHVSRNSVNHSICHLNLRRGVLGRRSLASNKTLLRHHCSFVHRTGWCTSHVGNGEVCLHIVAQHGICRIWFAMLLIAVLWPENLYIFYLFLFLERAHHSPPLIPIVRRVNMPWLVFMGTTIDYFYRRFGLGQQRQIPDISAVIYLQLLSYRVYLKCASGRHISK